MKNRKGEIATLLTLGLVLVGGLVTLVTSFIISRQSNLSSTPRASSAGTGCGSGAAYPCDPTEGYNPSVCKTTGLEYACCVQDKFYCDGEDRFRWFGCLGQPCRNTSINQSNGPGYLVACPAGVNQGNIESCAADLTPAPEEIDTGALGGPCEYNKGADFYKCDPGLGLTCSEQTSKGVCEKDTSDAEDTTNICLDKNDPSLSINYICISNSNSCPNQSPKGAYRDSSLSCGNDSQQCCFANKSDLTDTPEQDGEEDQIDEDLKESTPTLTNTPIPTITFNPSVQCTNRECSAPNQGLWYSYKCVGVSQIVGGVTQCPEYNFYQGKDCKNLMVNLNQGNAEPTFCSSGFPGYKRPVTISYTVYQTGAIDIDPANPTISLIITNYFGLGLFSQDFTIGSTTFPVSDSTTVNTGTNVIKASIIYYRNQLLGPTVIPCGSANVINGKANISCVIK